MTLGKIRLRDLPLVAEAFFLLAASSLLIALVPFRILGRIAAWKFPAATPDPGRRNAEIAKVRWAVSACARRAPWRAVCFQQGLAAQLMLRRRGIPSVLYYGAALDTKGGLAAHVWIRDGNVDVIGGEAANKFAVLATFPANPVA